MKSLEEPGTVLESGILGGLLLFTDDEAGRAAAERSFGGLRQLERGIRTMVRAGVERLVVVTPAGTKTALSAITRRLPAQIEFAEWGHEPTLRLDGEVLVLLGDHTHHHASLSEFVQTGLQGHDVVAQTTAGSQEIDLLTARVDAGGLRLEPALPDGQTPVSTGAFLVSRHLLPQQIVTAGQTWQRFIGDRSADLDVHLSTGQAHLWRRVVDRRSARQAKRMLFSQVTKPTSGPVSRHINARISIPISNVLIETGISPHMVTVLFVMTTGLAAAWLMSHPMPWSRLALAGFLWQMAAVLDRCDGEIARVKLCESQFGAWFDTVTDNIAYFCAYGAFLVAIQKLHPEQPLFFYAGISAVGAMILTLGIMYRYALKTGNGSLQKYLVGYAQLPAERKGWLYRTLERYSFVAKRDFFAFVHFLCAITNQFDLLYLYTVGGLHLLAIGAVISNQKMLAHHAEMNGTAHPEPGMVGEPVVVSVHQEPKG